LKRVTLSCQSERRGTKEGMLHQGRWPPSSQLIDQNRELAARRCPRRADGQIEVRIAGFSQRSSQSKTDGQRGKMLGQDEQDAIFCVSPDIHGNADALRQVFAEAENWGYDQVLVCGDLCFPGPEPLQVWKMLVERNALCVQGLSDKAVSQLNPSGC